MAHFDPTHYPQNHPGTSPAGERGFFGVVIALAVTALILMGLYFLAINALQGLAAFIPASL